MRCIYGLLIYLFNYSVLFVHGGRGRKFSCSRRNPEHGKIEVKYRGRIAKFVCDPGYVLRGDKLATCLKGSWDSFPKCEKVGGCAYLETLENGRVLISKDMSIIKFECDQGYKRSGGNETLACKDFSWERHKPTCEPDILRSCDFDENTICDWRNSTSTGFSWRLHQFKTPSHIINTGPSGDHTPGANAAGHYLYIETSGGMHSGSNNTRRFARLFSPMIFPMKGFETCFVFWYHMYGLTIGTLNVYVNNILRFTKSGNQGDRWYRGLVSNLPTNETFVIEIEGESGSSYLGDIAIDDIMITNSSECQKPMLIETTCRGRCYENEENTTLCRCNPDCSEDDSCCTDFMHYCSLSRYTFSAIKQEQTNTTLTYLSVILGVILIFTCLIGVSIYMFRRHKLHVPIQQEEAEVIYLTSDEALDFTVGRR
ncbi:MAM and LDL-receptor class A domain-containing protein 2-like isoform X2 [Cimex lectularius]|uniref:Uncharacterized protein n=1 Tax=Cimex lectularius TaxID=79782 RepID=A0A8I6TFU3_CIMLE|nr:MAM and LDL-receptor class A domain-containing protein 2-like isoform X2 [Cimex lectularius]